MNNNGIYILKSLSRSDEGFYKKLIKRGYQIVLIHTEGGIHYKDNKNSILSYFNPHLLEYVDFNKENIIICHNAVLRILYAHFLNIEDNNIPYLYIPLHTLFRINKDTREISEINLVK